MLKLVVDPNMVMGGSWTGEFLPTNTSKFLHWLLLLTIHHMGNLSLQNF